MYVSVSSHILQLALEDAEGSSSGPTAESTASFCTQLGWLVHREMLNTQRDVAALIGRFGVTIFISFLLGLIFLNAGMVRLWVWKEILWKKYKY